MIETTFVIIKPDAISRRLIGEIISRFEKRGLSIEYIETRRKTKAWCRKHYDHILLENLDVYHELEDFMADKKLIGIILNGHSAIKAVRAIVGCTNSLEAAPGTIRSDYGASPIRYNLVHASDSEDAVIREFGLFFDSSTDLRAI